MESSSQHIQLPADMADTACLGTLMGKLAPHHQGTLFDPDILVVADTRE